MSLKVVPLSVTPPASLAEITAPLDSVVWLNAELVTVNSPVDVVSIRLLDPVVVTPVVTSVDSVAPALPLRAIIDVSLNAYDATKLKPVTYSVPPSATTNENPLLCVPDDTESEQASIVSVNPVQRNSDECDPPSVPPTPN
jgi:hypothetical protein